MSITPEQFMATPQPDEDDDMGEEVQLLGQDPLISIAESLSEFLSMAKRHESQENEADQLQQTLDQLDREMGDLQDKLYRISQIIEKSTSKLANSIREVLDPAPVAEDATEPASALEVPSEPSSPVEQPADDAPVEEWRAYGARSGLDLTDNLNRSQIRPALGIPQPVTS